MNASRDDKYAIKTVLWTAVFAGFLSWNWSFCIFACRNAQCQSQIEFKFVLKFNLRWTLIVSTGRNTQKISLSTKNNNESWSQQVTAMAVGLRQQQWNLGTELFWLHIYHHGMHSLLVFVPKLNWFCSTNWSFCIFLVGTISVHRKLSLITKTRNECIPWW